MPNASRVMTFSAAFVVAVGAAFGGTLRYVVTSLVVARGGAPATPLATFAINVVGSLGIGIVVGVVQVRPELSPLWRLFFATGILGGFTTFSAFSLEALGLGGTHLALAAAYVVASVAFGIAATFAGLALGRAL